jgi:hypothetical protein
MSAISPSIDLSGDRRVRASAGYIEHGGLINRYVKSGTRLGNPYRRL